VRASLAEVLDAVLPQDALEMTLAEDDDMVDAFATNAAQEQCG
jgi:hypothetical protein